MPGSVKNYRLSTQRWEICSFLVSARKERKEAAIGGGFLQSRPLLCTTPPSQATPENIYTKGGNVPIPAHPCSKPHFVQKIGTLYAQTGAALRYSVVVKSGRCLEKVVLRARNQNNVWDARLSALLEEHSFGHFLAKQEKCMYSHG